MFLKHLHISSIKHENSFVYKKGLLLYLNNKKTANFAKTNSCANLKVCDGGYCVFSGTPIRKVRNSFTAALDPQGTFKLKTQHVTRILLWEDLPAYTARLAQTILSINKRGQLLQLSLNFNANVSDYPGDHTIAPRALPYPSW